MTNVSKLHLNKILRYATTFAVVAVLLVASAVAQAQTSKPVLVVSLPSINELLANIDFLARWAVSPVLRKWPTA